MAVFCAVVILVHTLPLGVFTTKPFTAVDCTEEAKGVVTATTFRGLLLTTPVLCKGTLGNNGLMLTAGVSVNVFVATVDNVDGLSMLVAH